MAMFFSWLFSLSVFIHIKWSLSKSVIVTDTVNPLEHLSLRWNDFSPNVNLWQLLLITKLMCCPKQHRTSVKKFTTAIIFVWCKAVCPCAWNVIAMAKEGFHFFSTLEWWKKKWKVGARRKCSSFVAWKICQGWKRKDDDSVGFFKNVWCDRCTIIPETCKMDFCYGFTGNTESYWIINCDHEQAHPHKWWRWYFQYYYKEVL